MVKTRAKGRLTHDIHSSKRRGSETSPGPTGVSWSCSCMIVLSTRLPQVQGTAILLSFGAGLDPAAAACQGPVLTAALLCSPHASHMLL